MECLHMNQLRDLIHRLRAGESERRIARDMNLSRTTVRKYRERAEPLGYLRPDQVLPDDATLWAMLDSGPRPPQVPSTVEPYHEVVQRLVDQGFGPGHEYAVSVFYRVQSGAQGLLVRRRQRQLGQP